MDFTAQEPCDLAADRQAQSGSSVLTARGAIPLTEGFPDDLLLVVRNAYTRISYLECDDLARAVQHLVIGTPTRFHAPHRQFYLAIFSELQRVGQQVLQ